MMEIVNNKEGRPLEHYSRLYSALDPAEAAKRCRTVYHEAEKEFETEFMGNVYRISFPCFDMRLSEKNTRLDCAADDNAVKILLLRWFIGGVMREPGGSFITYREAPWGEAYMRSFDGRCIKRLAFAYDGAKEKFAPAMELLGARRISGGDEGYELRFMKGLYVRMLVWAGDDEFPPSSQILFSDNFPSAFSAEDMAVVGDICISAMKKAEALI
ncbi:MAG: DUF3786 domain-containing protein [Oscillospiraceae bacterium]|nr:DUF3786 domain-containing protein [Oscillospiraceae bacterium]